MENSCISDELLAKFLSGKTTPDEQEIVFKYISEKPDNLQEIIDITEAIHAGENDSNQSIVSDELLAKFLSGNTTPEEEEIVFKYIAENTDNLQELIDITEAINADNEMVHPISDERVRDLLGITNDLEKKDYSPYFDAKYQHRVAAGAGFYIKLPRFISKYKWIFIMIVCVCIVAYLIILFKK